MIKVKKSSEREFVESLFREPDPINIAEAADTVRLILREVAEYGDKAIASYTGTFDGVSLLPEEFELKPDEIDSLAAKVDKKLIEALELAAARIESFHRRQLEKGYSYEDLDGVVLGQIVRPLNRVAIYVPGGKAVYPSTVLMNAIPAKAAGVKEVIMTSPPTAGGLPPVIVAAAKMAGVDRIFRLGGAQAVAAFGFGSKSVPKVDKIVGPGNRYVAEAKRQLFGMIDIDMFAGPSEVLIIADSSADPSFIALDMMAQAEHDEDARSILLTDSSELAKAVAAELKKEVGKAARKDIIKKALADGSAIVVVEDIDEAVSIANRIAAEHVEIITSDPEEILEQLQNAGSVFLGGYTPVTVGDYIAGPNHVLPTMGTARFASPLGVYDFVKRTGYTKFGKSQLAKIGPAAVLLAEAEGLIAHGEAISARLKKKK